MKKIKVILSAFTFISLLFILFINDNVFVNAATSNNSLIITVGEKHYVEFYDSSNVKVTKQTTSDNNYTYDAQHFNTTDVFNIKKYNSSYDKLFLQKYVMDGSYNLVKSGNPIMIYKANTVEYAIQKTSGILSIVALSSSYDYSNVLSPITFFSVYYVDQLEVTHTETVANREYVEFYKNDGNPVTKQTTSNNNYTYDIQHLEGIEYYKIPQFENSYDQLFLQKYILDGSYNLIESGTPIYLDHFDSFEWYINSVTKKIEFLDTGYSYVPFEDLKYFSVFYDKTNIIDTLDPVFEGETSFVTNVDNPISVTEILTHISAFDDVDGDLTNSIAIIADNYSLNKNNIGTYNITLEVTDSSDNSSTLVISVLVKDIVKPVITGTNVYTQSMATLLDVNIIKNNLSVTDNYESSLIVELYEDNYTSKYNIMGSYLVKFKTTDTSNNIGYYTVTITVIDDIVPVIEGPSEITKGTSETLTTQYIKSLFTANDNKNGDITSTIEIIEDNYSGNGDKVGVYTITFKAIDLSGNFSTKIITITVNDDIPPLFYVDNYFITVEESINLTLADLIKLITATGQLNVGSQATVSVLSSSYFGNENTVGTYPTTLSVSSLDGSYEEIELEIKVMATDTAGIIVEPDTEDDNGGFWNGFWSVLVWIWNAIVWFIKWIIGLFK